MNTLQEHEKRNKYLEKIYGQWFNLVAAGSLFIIYAIIAIFYNSFFKDIIPIPNLLERFPGIILVIMGFFFGRDALYIRFKKNIKNNVLLARGIFDLLSGILILMMPAFGFLMTSLVMGLALIHIGIKNLTSLDSNLFDFILSVILIPVGLSDIDVINFIFPDSLRVLIFAVFLGCLGIYLVSIARNYKEGSSKYFSK